MNLEMAYNVLAICGVIAIILLSISSIFEIVDYFKKKQAKKKTLSISQRYAAHSSPEFTEEEQFYADLLLKKIDLDADAFATRKSMLDEYLKHK